MIPTSRVSVGRLHNLSEPLFLYLEMEKTPSGCEIAAKIKMDDTHRWRVAPHRTFPTTSAWVCMELFKHGHDGERREGVPEAEGGLYVLTGPLLAGFSRGRLGLSQEYSLGPQPQSQGLSSHPIVSDWWQCTFKLSDGPNPLP